MVLEASQASSSFRKPHFRSYLRSPMAYTAFVPLGLVNLNSAYNMVGIGMELSFECRLPEFPEISREASVFGRNVVVPEAAGFWVEIKEGRRRCPTNSDKSWLPRGPRGDGVCRLAVYGVSSQQGIHDAWLEGLAKEARRECFGKRLLGRRC